MAGDQADEQRTANVVTWKGALNAQLELLRQLDQPRSRLQVMMFLQQLQERGSLPKDKRVPALILRQLRTRPVAVAPTRAEPGLPRTVRGELATDAQREGGEGCAGILHVLSLR